MCYCLICNKIQLLSAPRFESFRNTVMSFLNGSFLFVVFFSFMGVFLQLSSFPAIIHIRPYIKRYDNYQYQVQIFQPCFTIVEICNFQHQLLLIVITINWKIYAILLARKGATLAVLHSSIWLLWPNYLLHKCWEKNNHM